MNNKLSIVIAMYNAEQTIGATLASIYPKAEVNTDFEVIIVDDGSIDDSKKIVDDWSKRTYTDITVLDGGHQGVSHARNMAIDYARGRYITFMDSDDCFSNNDFEAIIDFFDNHFEETDIVTYPLVYVNSYSGSDVAKYGFPLNQTELDVSIDSKTHEAKYTKKLLAAKQKLFDQGTGIYDVTAKFWLAQKTVNVLIKNLRLVENADPIYFEEDIPNGEDSMFMTRYVEQKGTIGYFNQCEFQYLYYRRGDSTVQKFLSPVDSYEMVLLWAQRMIELNLRSDGTLSKYVQAIILDEFGWRIKSTNFYPVHLPADKYADWETQIKEILQYISPEVFKHGLAPNPTMPRFVLNNLIEMRGPVEIEASEKGLDFYQNGQKVMHDYHFETILSGAEFHDNVLHLDAAAKHAFSDLYETTPFYVLNGKRVDFPEKYVSTESFYMQKLKTHQLVGFKADIDLTDIQEGELKIGYEILGHEYYPDLMFIRNTRLFPDKLGLNHTAVEGIDFEIDYTHFVINFARYENKMHTFSTAVAFSDANNTEIVNDLTRYGSSINEPIWLYSDTIGKVDNAYLQFKHDINKQDGVIRKYVVHPGYEEYMPDFEAYQNNFVEFGSLEHKKLFLNTNAIIAAFQGIDTFSPYSKPEITRVRGIFNLNVVYLQHGLLHASIQHIYSQERVDFYKRWVVSSQMEFDELIENYHLDKSEIIQSGMPRFAQRHTEIKPKTLKHILYAPSWRRNLMLGQSYKGSGWQPNEGLMKKSIIIKTIEELYSNEDFNNWLRVAGIQLDIKLHPIMQEFVSAYLKDTDTIKVVNSVENMSEYDLFVTDYSSFMYDAVADNVPVLLYQPDYDYFVDGVHTFRDYVTPNDRTLADQVFTFDEFFNELKQMQQNPTELNKHLSDYQGFLTVADDPMEMIYTNVSDATFNKMTVINVNDFDVKSKMQAYIEHLRELDELNFVGEKITLETKQPLAIFSSPDLEPRTRLNMRLAEQTIVKGWSTTNHFGQPVIVTPYGFINGENTWIKYLLGTSPLMQKHLVDMIIPKPDQMQKLIERNQKGEIDALKPEIRKATLQRGLPTTLVMIDDKTKVPELISLQHVKWNLEGRLKMLTSEGTITQTGKTFIKPRKDFQDYVTEITPDVALVAHKNLSIYDSVDFKDEHKTNQKIEKHTKLEHVSIAWTKGGTPRIKLTDGYISANKKNIAKFTELDAQMQKLLGKNILLVDGEIQHYQADKVYGTNQVSVASIDDFLVTEDGKYQAKLSDGQFFDLNEATGLQLVRSRYEDFIYRINAGSAVQLIKPQHIYSNTDFNPANKLRKAYATGDKIKVQGIAWTKGGTPRLVVENGYISANKQNVMLTDLTFFESIGK